VLLNGNQKNGGVLQLVHCTYLLTVSKYFKWGWTSDFGIKSKISPHRGEHRRVMKLEVWPSESAFGFDSQDSKVRLSSIKVCRLILKMGHKTHG